MNGRPARRCAKRYGMPRVSLTRPDPRLDPNDPPDSRRAMWRFGESLGAERVGTTPYELPPGEAVCPYHYEHSAEEWLLVLDGNPTPREPMASTNSSRWTSPCFAPGPGGAHQVRNDTADTIRMRMWGRESLPSGGDLTRTATRSLSGPAPNRAPGCIASGPSSTTTTARAIGAERSSSPRQTGSGAVRRTNRAARVSRRRRCHALDTPAATPRRRSRAAAFGPVASVSQTDSQTTGMDDQRSSGPAERAPAS